MKRQNNPAEDLKFRHFLLLFLVLISCFSPSSKEQEQLWCSHTGTGKELEVLLRDFYKNLGKNPTNHLKPHHCHDPQGFSTLHLHKKLRKTKGRADCWERGEELLLFPGQVDGLGCSVGWWAGACSEVRGFMTLEPFPALMMPRFNWCGVEGLAQLLPLHPCSHPGFSPASLFHWEYFPIFSFAARALCGSDSQHRFSVG